VPSSIATATLLGAIALALAGIAAGGVALMVLAALIWEVIVAWPRT